MRGLLFKFEFATYTESPAEQTLLVKVRPSETQSVDFSTRNKIQRGDGAVDPFIPTNQVQRDTFEYQTRLLEDRISEAFSIDKSDYNTDNDL